MGKRWAEELLSPLAVRRGCGLPHRSGTTVSPVGSRCQRCRIRSGDPLSSRCAALIHCAVQALPSIVSGGFSTWLANPIHKLHAVSRQANEDALTGLSNRAARDTVGPALLTRTSRLGNEVSAIVVDLDRFKPINDTYGHAAGDAVMLAMHGLANKVSTLLATYKNPALLAEGKGRGQEILSQIQARMGIRPNLFKPVSNAAALERLWNAAQLDYLDAPFPSLFKEKLFVSLSRFCNTDYCFARHVGFLLGSGHGYPAGDSSERSLSLGEVKHFLERSHRSESQIAEAAARLNRAGPLDEGAWDQSLEEDLIDCLNLLNSRDPVAHSIAQCVWHH